MGEWELVRKDEPGDLSDGRIVSLVMQGSRVEGQFQQRDGESKVQVRLKEGGGGKASSFPPSVRSITLWRQVQQSSAVFVC